MKFVSAMGEASHGRFLVSCDRIKFWRYLNRVFYSLAREIDFNELCFSRHVQNILTSPPSEYLASMPLGPHVQRVGLLIVSDAASKDPSLDKIEATLSQVLAEDGTSQWTIAECDIVPDDANAIREKVESWTILEKDVRLLLTSGGTGFAQRDITPETIEPLLDKHAPGLVYVENNSMQTTQC